MMTNKPVKPRVICFGEILWDNLPSGRTAGGAPMNVAYHLNRVAAESQLISRIGDDQAGTDLITFSSEKGLPTNLLQKDPRYPTGEVIAKVMDNHEVVYEILPDAAWDFIAADPQIKLLAGNADAFVFGSLAARSSVSRDSLLQILEYATFKVFDINLRAPHYSKEILALLLSKADLLKLNDDELILLTDWFYQSGAAEGDCIKFLQQTFGIAEVVVTKGSKGASYYSGEVFYTGKAYPITVADTVGAGDSFLAAFLYKKLTGTAIPEALDYALAMGAFIASQSGACPAYTLSDLDAFIAKHHPED
jgi:fructokinase